MRRLSSIPTASVYSGVTLVELLLAFGLLGLIVAFTVPKVLQEQQNQAWNAAAKETMTMIQAAYQAYEIDRDITTGTKLKDLTPYLNYVRVDTSGALIDHGPGRTSLVCDSSQPCLRLHNGGVLLYGPIVNFGAGSSSNFVYFMFDPDG